ncbi:MAG: hypothetical protein JST55_10010 [Bacteroidetes bacterium]|nr:hypothetical protein [Bacteroidota bacterium]
MKTPFLLLTYVILIFFITELSLTAQVQTSQPFNFITKLCFRNALTGYAVGGTNQNGSYVLKTLDGGNSWQKVTSSCTSYLTDIKFISDNTGYCCSVDGEVAVTTNGGSEWIKIYQCLNSHSFTIGMFDSFSGFLCGQGAFKRILQGGAGWYVDPLNTQSYITASSVLSSSKAAICGINDGAGQQYGLLMYTTNSGINWFGSSYNADIPDIQFNDISFINENTGYVAGDKGNFFKTVNGGALWNVLPAPTTKTILSVFFINNSSGYIGGQDLFMRSTDGGANFNAVNLNSTSNNTIINDIYFSDANLGLAAGNIDFSAVIFRTTNGGVNWKQNTLLF